MVLKKLFPALLGAALMLAGAAAVAADQYRPDQFLNLDLSKAVLSPKPLGPSEEFVHARVEAESEPSGVLVPNDARKVAVERINVQRTSAQRTKAARTQARAVVRVAEAKPRGAARVRLAHRGGNPLNALARDTRIQRWPCNPDTGGICNWR